MMLLSITAFSQVEIVENFDTAAAYTLPADWTETGFFVPRPENQCGGTGQSAITTLEFAGASTLTTPNYTVITNDTDLTISFSANVFDQNGTGGPWGGPITYESPSTDWGSLVLEYTLDGGENWILAYTLDDSNYTYVDTETCFTIPTTSMGALTAGSDFQARFTATAVNIGYTFLVFTVDNISITQVATEIPNCDAVLLTPVDGETAAAIDTTLSWQAATGLPTGYTLSVGTTSGGTDIVNAVAATGTTYSLDGLLAYETEYFVNIVPNNSFGAATVGCTEQSFTTRVTPIDGATCSKPLVIDLDVANPYVSLQNTVDFENNLSVGPCGGFSGAYINGNDVYYEITPTTDVSIDLDLLVTSGSNPGIHIMNDCPDVATECIAFIGANQPQLALTDVVLSAGNTYFIIISSAGNNSTIDYTLIISKNDCIHPEFTYAIVEDCDNDQYFVDVDVTYLGLASSLALTDYTGNISSTGIVQVGPYASGTTFDLTLTNNDNGDCYFEETVYYFCSPANDDCGGSSALTINTDENCTVVYSGTNAGATENAANPIFCEAGFSNTNDVWYTFVATSATVILEYSNIVTVIGEETDFNTAQATELLSGNCGTFTSLQCSRFDYMVFNDLTIGDTYYIRNSSRSNDVAHTYDMCLRQPTTPPANDECTGAIALTLSTEDICDDLSFTTEGATPSLDNSCSDDYADVWFEFTAAEAGIYQFTFSREEDSFIPSANFMVYSGECGALVEKSANCYGNEYNSQPFAMESGETFYIMVRAAQTAPSLEFDLCVFQLPDAVENNECSDAITILESDDETGNNMVSGDFANAYPSSENTCNTGTNAMWYSFTPTYTGLYNINFVRTLGFPSYSVYNTDDCSATASDNLVSGTYCTNNTFPIDPEFVAGNTYLIAVYSYDSEATFELLIYPDATLSVGSTSIDSFKYYPNPIVNTLTIEATSTISNVSVFNIVGQKVQIANPNSLEATINMEELISGVYFVTITANGSQNTIKVVKK